MHALLKSRNETPVTGLPSVNKTASALKPGLSPALRRRLLAMHVSSFDWKRGGLNTPVKFLDRDSMEYSLTQAVGYDRNEETMVRKTLDAGLSLVDPVWGGIYPFSTQHDWQHPHFKRTMAAQAGCLRLYSLAYAQFRELRYLNAARQIYRYMIDFLLSPDAAFYSGQDDYVSGIDPRGYFSLPHFQRLQHGLPAIDKRMNVRDNGWAVEALACLYEFTGEQHALKLARRTGGWLLSSHKLNGINFNTAMIKAVNGKLADSLAFGRAMLQLYRATTEYSYLKYADKTADVIGNYFKAEEGGFNSSIQGSYFSPQQIDENISTTRFLNLLSIYTDEPRHAMLAGHGMRYLSIPEVATARMEEAGILLLDEELTTPPLHITIAGNKYDPLAKKLYSTALQAYGWFKVINWRSPAALATSAQTPASRACAYLKKELYCSGPVYDPRKLVRLIKSV